MSDKQPVSLTRCPRHPEIYAEAPTGNRGGCPICAVQHVHGAVQQPGAQVRRRNGRLELVRR